MVGITDGFSKMLTYSSSCLAVVNAALDTAATTSSSQRDLQTVMLVGLLSNESRCLKSRQPAEKHPIDTKERKDMGLLKTSQLQLESSGGDDA